MSEVPSSSEFDVVPDWDPTKRAVLPSGQLAPQTIHAQASGPALRYHIELELEFRGGRYEVSWLTAKQKRSKDGRLLGPEVTGEGLRQLAVREIVREVIKQVATKGMEGLMLFTSKPSPDLFRRVNDEALATVAGVYRAALEEGKPPAQTVADYLGMPRSTAARWIARTRERGFLGPATPGKAGETTQPKRRR